VREIERDEGRFFVHPYNGYRTILGTATLGAEWAEQSGGLDAVIIAIGGGGTAAGAGTAFKLALPGIQVFGVEPAGADLMAQSFAAGGAMKIGAMHGIADSLMAPHTEAYSFGLCRRHLDGLVTVTDDALRAAMLLLFDELKLATEPACAAATAALLGHCASAWRASASACCCAAPIPTRRPSRATWKPRKRDNRRKSRCPSLLSNSLVKLP